VSLHVGFVRRWSLLAALAMVPSLGGLLWLGDLLTWTSAIAVLVICGLIYLLLRRPIRAWNLAIGALVGWAILAIVIGLMIPGASYLFVWPLLFALIPAAWAFRRRPLTSPTLVDASLMAICALPAVLWFSGLAYLFYAAMGMSMVGVAIALVALFRPGPLQSGMVDDYIPRSQFNFNAAFC